MGSAQERQLDKDIQAKLGGNQDAQSAYDNLLKSDLFGKQDSRGSTTNRDARIAIMEQVKNYPEKAVIDDLTQMGDRNWFRNQGFEDQQRSAKMIGFNTSETTPNANQTRQNTVDRILENDDINLKWEKIESNPGTTTWGRAGGDRGKGARIILNNEFVSAGADKIDPGDSKAIKVAVDTLAHEVNHTLTPGGNEQSYAYFMDEYRAWNAGFTATNGHPPTAKQAYDRAYYLTDKTSGSYANIGKALRDDGSDDQKNIVSFMAGLMGLDPATATFDDVRNKDKFNNDGPALLPVKAKADDPNNIDNHG
ncbi:hypothetical protein [Paracoccus sp. (in: a-proteobacteria)]|uniref:hypothetical protein n=1 Tax=Paracoccus sp. TaxID=267 RepID=UPI003A8B2C25